MVRGRRSARPRRGPLEVLSRCKQTGPASGPGPAAGVRAHALELVGVEVLEPFRAQGGDAL